MPISGTTTGSRKRWFGDHEFGDGLVKGDCRHPEVLDALTKGLESKLRTPLQAGIRTGDVLVMIDQAPSARQPPVAGDKQCYSSSG